MLFFAGWWCGLMFGIHLWSLVFARRVRDIERNCDKICEDERKFTSDMVSKIREGDEEHYRWLESKFLDILREWKPSIWAKSQTLEEAKRDLRAVYNPPLPKSDSPKA